MVIFDCNGVLVDSERIAASVVERELARAGFPAAPVIAARVAILQRNSED